MNNKSIKVIVMGGSAITMNLVSDGWYECDGLAINPSKTRCVTSPWYGDGFCEAPEHKFKIIEESNETN
jgi:hypothetical protein